MSSLWRSIDGVVRRTNAEKAHFRTWERREFYALFVTPLLHTAKPFGVRSQGGIVPIGKPPLALNNILDDPSNSTDITMQWCKYVALHTFHRSVLVVLKYRPARLDAERYLAIQIG